MKQTVQDVLIVEHLPENLLPAALYMFLSFASNNDDRITTVQYFKCQLPSKLRLNKKILIVYKCLLTVYLAQIKGSYMFIQNRQLLTVSILVPFYRGV